MPEVNGFDVVAALNDFPETAQIAILVVTARQVTAGDRVRLNLNVKAIVGKTDFDHETLATEVRRAMVGREWST
jgi:CheY-like chemotaxis protein